MRRIDCHQHFWEYDAQKHVWMNETMGVLKKDYGPEQLEPLLKLFDIAGCVAIQASQSEMENDFLLGLADTFNIIKGIVGWVDLRSGSLRERLSHYKSFSKMKGFRHVIHDEPGIDFMLQPAFLKGIHALGAFGFTYDILIFSKHLLNTRVLVSKFPDQRFVIDHIGKPEIRNGQFEDWKTQLAGIATLPNVYCKISGLVTEARWRQWQKADFGRYLDAVVDMFGAERIMYGSDWPVCTLSASYEEQFRIVDDYFSAFSKTEQENVFGLNAMKFYDL